MKKVYFIIALFFVSVLGYTAADRVIQTHELRMTESGGGDSISLKPPALSGSYTLTLPAGAGTSGYLLKTDGSGNLSFTDELPNPVGGNVVIGDPGTEGSGILIGGVNYDSTFKVADIDGTNFAQTILHRHSTILEPLIVGARSNTNDDSHANMSAGQNLFTVYGAGTAGDDYKLFGSMSIGVSGSGTISQTSAPGRLLFNTTPNGSVTPTATMMLDQDKTATFYGSILGNTLTASRLVVTDASKNLVSSATTATEVGLLSGLTDILSSDNTKTVTNKTINGSNNTITNVSLTTAVTGTLPIANGGTGQTTANAALNALLPSQATHAGKALISDGTNTAWTAISATAGGSDTQVQYNSGGSLTGSSNFVWDNANTRLGVGLSSPSESLNVSGNILAERGSGTEVELAVKGYSIPPVFHGYRASGTKASPTGVLNGELITGLGSRPYDGSAFTTHSTGSIHFVANENITDSAQGTEMRFLVTPKGTTHANRKTAFTIKSDASDSGVRFVVRAQGAIKDRFLFQGDGVGGDNTGIGVVPTSAGNIGQFTAYNNADPTSAASIGIRATSTSVDLWNQGLPLALYSGGSERIRVSETTGNVAIGTTAFRSNLLAGSATPRLQVEGTDLSSGTISVVRNADSGGGPFLMLGKTRGSTLGSNTVIQAGDSMGIVTFQGMDGTNFIEGARIQAIVDTTPGSSDMPGRLQFMTTADGEAAPTERMRINSQGRIGINTTELANRLTVVSNSDAADAAGSGNGMVRFATGTGQVTDDSLIFGITSNGHSWMQPVKPGSTTKDLYLAPLGGQVSVGTTTPAANFHVVGTTRMASTSSADSLVIFANNDSVNNITSVGRASDNLSIIRFVNNAFTAEMANINSGGNGINFATTATNRMNINNDGNVTISVLAGAGTRTVVADSAGMLATTSDSRLKDEDKSLAIPGLKEVLQITPRAYKWKKDVERIGKKAASEIGFFADEVAPIIPSAAPKEQSGLYGFYDRPILAALVKSVQELNEENKKLKDESKQIKLVLCKYHPEEELCQ